MITVFYDGKCGLCSREIEHYRKIAPKGVFDWQEISESETELKKLDLSLLEALKVFHVKDKENNLHKGVDAFLVIWRHLDRWRVLASILSLPLIRHLAYFAYHHFAKWRFKRLKHCQLVAEQDKQRD